jgi:hypothetical protein
VRKTKGEVIEGQLERKDTGLNGLLGGRLGGVLGNDTAEEARKIREMNSGNNYDG